ncbi:unnamed protein product [Mortierella alpina]
MEMALVQAATDMIQVVDLAPPPTRDAQGKIMHNHFTCLSTRGDKSSMSRIDYIMTSPYRRSDKYEVTSAPFVNSDHRRVSAVINGPIPKPATPPKASSSLDIRLLKCPDFQAAIRT